MTKIANGKKLKITNCQIAKAFQDAGFNIADSTFRCFRLMSAPHLAFDRLPPNEADGIGARGHRGYHLGPIIAWLRKSTHRFNAEVESHLYKYAAQNMEVSE